jgi:hypothetical protein
MNELELDYKDASDVSIKINDVDMKGVSTLSLGMKAGELPALALTFDLSNIKLKLTDADIDIKLYSPLPNELEEMISKTIKRYYMNKETNNTMKIQCEICNEIFFLKKLKDGVCPKCNQKYVSDEEYHRIKLEIGQKTILRSLKEENEDV